MCIMNSYYISLNWITECYNSAQITEKYYLYSPVKVIICLATVIKIQFYLVCIPGLYRPTMLEQGVHRKHGIKWVSTWHWVIWLIFCPWDDTMWTKVCHLTDKKWVTWLSFAYWLTLIFSVLVFLQRLCLLILPVIIPFTHPRKTWELKCTSMLCCPSSWSDKPNAIGCRLGPG